MVLKSSKEVWIGQAPSYIHFFKKEMDALKGVVTVHSTDNHNTQPFIHTFLRKKWMQGGGVVTVYFHWQLQYPGR